MVSDQATEEVNVISVLYSRRDSCWKLTDFGTASLATSKNLVTTRQVRGTDCFLAPEVLGTQKFNNRSDMFALGCIIFQCVAGRELFPNSWAIQMYSQDTTVLPGTFDQFWPVTTLGSRLQYLQDLATDLLSVEPTSRPGAAQTRRRLNRIRDIGWDEPQFPTIQESSADVIVDEFFSVPDQAPLDDRFGLQDGWSSKIPAVASRTPLPIELVGMGGQYLALVPD